MKRKALNILKNWYNRKTRHPLIIRGARQTGKSTLVRIFCEEMKLNLCEINLEVDKVPEFFKEDRFNIQNALNQIEAIVETRITENTLLFIDEIQEQHYAVKWLRYFFEKRPKIAVIAAGSLLEVVLKDKAIEIPVGRIEYLHLGPMTFREFLWAKEKKRLAEYIFEFNNENPIPMQFHEELIHLLKEYYFVGGMPEAIMEYLENGPQGAKEVHRRIIQTYEDDLKKYASNKTGEALVDIFRNLPAYVGEKTILTKLSRNKSTNVNDAIELLTLARVIHRSFHTNCSGIPIKATEDKNTSALFFLDVGLMNHILGLGYKNIIELNGDKIVTSGRIAEQFIATHLAYRFEEKERPYLNFFLRDKHPQKAQIDFIIQHGPNIIPIEVKAGTTGKMKGLHIFMEEKELPCAIRFDAKYRERLINQCEYRNSKDKDKDKNKSGFTLINLPLYQVELLNDSNIEAITF